MSDLDPRGFYFDPTEGSGTEAPFVRPKLSQVLEQIAYVDPESGTVDAQQAVAEMDAFLDEGEYVLPDEFKPYMDEHSIAAGADIPDAASDVEVTDLFVPEQPQAQDDLHGLLFAQLQVLVAIAEHIGVKLS